MCLFSLGFIFIIQVTVFTGITQLQVKKCHTHNTNVKSYYISQYDFRAYLHSEVLHPPVLSQSPKLSDKKK